MISFQEKEKEEEEEEEERRSLVFLFFFHNGILGFLFDIASLFLLLSNLILNECRYYFKADDDRRILINEEASILYIKLH